MNHLFRTSASTRSCRLNKDAKRLQNLYIQAGDVGSLGTNGKEINANRRHLTTGVGPLERRDGSILAEQTTSEAETTRQGSGQRRQVITTTDQGDAQIWMGRHIRHRHRDLITLDPSKLVELGQPPFYIYRPGSSTPILKLRAGNKIPVAMAVNTAPLMGFFYYHLPAGRPAISGEVRFRVTPTSDPASFSEGYDLMNTQVTAIPWRTRLVNMPHSKHLHPLLVQLVSDKLVSPRLARSVERLAQQPGAKALATKSNAIFTFEDDFLIQFSKTCCVTIGVFTEKEQHVSRYLFFPSHPGLYKSGLIRAQFERSLDPIDPSRRLVQVRCLEILQPVELLRSMDEGYMPRAGQLILEKASPRSPFKPRQRYLDDKAFAGLKILW